MLKVTVTGPNVVLVREPLILPEPLAAIPVTATLLSLVQLYTVPGIALPDNTIVVIAVPEHIICEEGVAVAVTGAGQLITRLYTPLVPVQLLASVTVTVMLNVPACVGVPLNTPAVDKLNPVGKVLAVVNETGNAPPLWVKV